MKSNPFFILLVLSFIFLSCEKDDNSPSIKNTAEELIIGNWSMTDFDSENTVVTVNYLGQQLPVPVSSTGSNYNLTLLFKESPKTVSSEGYFTLSVSGNFLGQTLDESFNSDEFMRHLFMGNWKVSNEKLLVEQEGITNTFDIISLTANELKLMFDIAHEISNNNVEGTLNTQIQITFTH